MTLFNRNNLKLLSTTKFPNVKIQKIILIIICFKDIVYQLKIDTFFLKICYLVNNWMVNKKPFLNLNIHIFNYLNLIFFYPTYVIALIYYIVNNKKNLFLILH